MVLFVSSAMAAPLSALYDGPDGVTCDYFNRGAQVAWKHRAGDWVDANKRGQGMTPFSKVALTDRDSDNSISMDVTVAAREAVRLTPMTLSIAIVPLSAGGTGVAAVHSKEDPNLDRRPALVIEYASGGNDIFWPQADTYTDCTTNASLGSADRLLSGGGRIAFIVFDLSKLRPRSEIAKTTLRLVRTPSRYGDLTIGTFLLDRQTIAANVETSRGLAANYPKDKGIEGNPDVFMATGFDTTQWQEAWTSVNTYGSAATFDTVAKDDKHQFVPLLGRALRVRIPKGSNLGLDLRYEFARKHSAEPDDAYFRYYLRLADDWRPTVDGGKMPGFSGTYGVAGWGDRPADPLKGWSMRGSFGRLPDTANPLQAYVTMGTYATHPEPKGSLGEVWPWTVALNGLLERNRWYCVEQYIKLNSPGSKNGTLRVWIDGNIAFEKTDLRVRDTAALKVESVWMNVYHGGTAPAPQDMHLFIDNVVIARKYIGQISSP